MKCQKDTLIITGILLTVISITSGLMFDQINQVNAEVDKRTEIVYSIPSIQDDISEIKTDIKEIRKYILENTK